MVTYKLFVLIRKSCPQDRKIEIENGLDSLFDEWAADRLSSFEFEIFKEEETLEKFPLWREFRNISRDDCYWVFYNPVTGKPTICSDVEQDDTLNIGYKGSHKDTPLQYIEKTFLDLLQERKGFPLVLQNLNIYDNQ